jgi:hypothetical protein
VLLRVHWSTLESKALKVGLKVQDPKAIDNGKIPYFLTSGMDRIYPMHAACKVIFFGD